MNRAERRKHGNKDKVPTYNLTQEQLDALVREAIEAQVSEIRGRVIRFTIDGVTAAFIMSLSEYYGFGKQRLKYLTSIVQNQFECIEAGTVDLEEIIKFCNEKYDLNLREKV